MSRLPQLFSSPEEAARPVELNYGRLSGARAIRRECVLSSTFGFKSPKSTGPKSGCALRCARLTIERTSGNGFLPRASPCAYQCTLPGDHLSRQAAPSQSASFSAACAAPLLTRDGTPTTTGDLHCKFRGTVPRTVGIYLPGAACPEPDIVRLEWRFRSTCSEAGVNRSCFCS